MRILIFVVVAIVFFAVIIFTGCVHDPGRPVGVATDEPLIGGQTSVAKLQAVNGSLRDLLQAYDGYITEQGHRAIGGIDEALDRLDEYDEFVQRLIARVRELESLTRTGDN